MPQSEASFDYSNDYSTICNGTTSLCSVATIANYSASNTGCETTTRIENTWAVVLNECFRNWQNQTATVYMKLVCGGTDGYSVIQQHYSYVNIYMCVCVCFFLSPFFFCTLQLLFISVCFCVCKVF